MVKLLHSLNLWSLIVKRARFSTPTLGIGGSLNFNFPPSSKGIPNANYFNKSFLWRGVWSSYSTQLFQLSLVGVCFVFYSSPAKSQVLRKRCFYRSVEVHCSRIIPQPGYQGTIETNNTGINEQNLISTVHIQNTIKKRIHIYIYEYIIIHITTKK